MAKHHEISFEDVICARLVEGGWLFAPGDAEAYDRARALFPADVVDWVKVSQATA